MTSRSVDRVEVAPQAPPLNGAARYAHIDAMRAFAVLLVVVAHAGLGHIVPGGSGVTIFFSISGFIITYLTLREKDKTGGFSLSGFYARRAYKIFPPFALIIVIPTLIYSTWGAVDWSDFASQVFFVWNWVYLNGSVQVMPGSPVVWSLAIEEQFYIVFALLWAVVVVRRWGTRALTVVAALAVLVANGLRLWLAGDPEMSHRIYYGTDTRLDGIACGVLAAVLYHHWQSRPESRGSAYRAAGSDWTLVLSVGLYLASLVIRDPWFRDTLRFDFQSLAASVIIVYGLVPGRGPLRKLLMTLATWYPVALIGLASYSIYLVHLVLINVLRGSMSDFPLGLKVLLLSLVSLAAGFLFYWFVEKPVQRYRLRASSKESVAATSSS